MDVGKCPTCNEGHPYIISQESKETSYIIACDGHLISIGTSFSKALDFLFKFFGCLYPCGLIFANVIIKMLQVYNSRIFFSQVCSFEN